MSAIEESTKITQKDTSLNSNINYKAFVKMLYIPDNNIKVGSRFTSNCKKDRS